MGFGDTVTALAEHAAQSLDDAAADPIDRHAAAPFDTLVAVLPTADDVDPMALAAPMLCERGPAICARRPIGRINVADDQDVHSGAGVGSR